MPIDIVIFCNVYCILSSSGTHFLEVWSACREEGRPDCCDLWDYSGDNCGISNHREIYAKIARSEKGTLNYMAIVRGEGSEGVLQSSCRVWWPVDYMAIVRGREVRVFCRHHVGFGDLWIIWPLWRGRDLRMFCRHHIGFGDLWIIWPLWGGREVRVFCRHHVGFGDLWIIWPLWGGWKWGCSAVIM